MSNEANMAVLNPAYFTWWQKPEILWNDNDREAQHTEQQGTSGGFGGVWR